MRDVTTPLQQLIANGLLRLGRLHGRTEPFNLLEAYRRLDTATSPAGEKWASYELVRRAALGEHTNIGLRAARTIATMLDVPPEDVLKAAGKPVPLGAFRLPEKADALTGNERRAVLGVIDAILDARSRPAAELTGDEPQELSLEEAARLGHQQPADQSDQA